MLNTDFRSWEEEQVYTVRCVQICTQINTQIIYTNTQYTDQYTAQFRSVHFQTTIIMWVKLTLIPANKTSQCNNENIVI